jgi:hypothetical protein
MKFIAAVFMLGSLCLSSIAAAVCDVSLLHDIRVSSKGLTVSDGGVPVFEIRQGGLLSIEGADVQLSEEQRDLVEEYAGDVGALLPQWILGVSDSLAMVEKSLESALTTAFGADSVPVQKSALAMAKARHKFEEYTSASDGEYSISSGVFNNIEDSFGEEFSEEMEEAVLSSLGSVFAEVGKAMMSSPKNFDARMSDFTDRMSEVGHDLGVMGDSMEHTGDILCGETMRMQTLEKRVARKVPALAQYPLFAS